MGRHGIRNQVWVAWLVVVWMVGPCLDVHGQDAPEQAVELGTVLVSPRRIPGLFVNASEFPGSATIITVDDIERSGASSLPDLFKQLAGVTVMDTIGFGLGSDGSVHLRGVGTSSASRTNALVLLNGVRQNRLTGDEVHWQLIPLEQIERIELIRGGGSLIYGEGALSGLINIVTKQDAERLLETEQGVEVGSFGQQRYFTSGRGRLGPLRYGASIHRRQLSGYRESTNSRTTTVTSDVGMEVLPTLHVDVHVLHSEDTSRFPGGVTPEASEARRRQQGSFAGFFDERSDQVSLESIWSGPMGLSLVANYFWRMRESDSVTTSRFATLTPAQGLSLRGGHEVRGGTVGHTLVAGIDLLDEKASTGTRTATYSESNKASYGLFAEETLRLFDRASLVAGLRFDQARFEEAISFPEFVGTLRFQGWSPKVGLSVDVTEALTIYASYARPFKAPNVDDFSATVPTGFVGNLDLEPQQADDYELGFRVNDPRVGAVEMAWFYTKINDEILFNDLSDQNQNFDTERTGVEVSLKPALPVPWATSAITYTFMDSEFRKSTFKDNTLPAVPEHRLTANVTVAPIPEKVFVWLDWLLVNDFFRINDFNNVTPGDNYGVLTVGARYVHKHVTVYFRIENVTNEEYTSFQSSNGVMITTGENPAPPRSFIGGVTVRF